MTVEEMRREMREKVVPEEVVPQNVVNCLIDEDAEPPKLDAFAFLMRLRTLGIGSADFIALLEGCDAPESVVNKIKQNPAMNLQGLVLTLEGSELTTEDYTRMLLTARQVWERTLTLRLERSEKISLDMKTESEEAEEEHSESSKEDVYGETEEPDSADEDDFYYDEDLQEMSFTAVFNKINEEIREGVLTAEAPAAEPEEVREDAQTAEAAADVSEPREDQLIEETDAESDSFAAAFDKIKSGKQLAVTTEIEKQAAAGAVGDTTALVGIDEELLRESFDNISEETDETEEPTKKKTHPAFITRAR